MTQASSPVALRAAPPATACGARRRAAAPPRRRAAAPPRPARRPAPGPLADLAARRAGQVYKSRASGTTIPGIRTDRMCHSSQKRWAATGRCLILRRNSTRPRAAPTGIRATSARAHPQVPRAVTTRRFRSNAPWSSTRARSPAPRPSGGPPRACSRSTPSRAPPASPLPPPSSPAGPSPHPYTPTLARRASPTDMVITNTSMCAASPQSLRLPPA